MSVDLTPAPHEITIKIRAFPYYRDVEDPVQPGRVVRQERVAVRGETVNVTDVDYARAQKFDAIEAGDDDAGPSEDPVASGSLDVGTATVPDLSAWIKSERPTVDEVVEEANNDPEKARKLLEAEDHATGGQPRSTLVEQLQEIAG
jgi:hypothetical protein